MCMGMMNYREQENELTVITCKSCGRAWQTTKAAAEQFEIEQGGLCAACRESKTKKLSLLKPYTNFEKIKSMTLDEMACYYPCPYSKDFDGDERCKHKDCIECTKQWLESEAEG